jgi:hypothetical protein
MSERFDSDEPIFLRVYRGIESLNVVARMDFQQLLEENAGLEQLVERVTRTMLTDGVCDDIDYRAQVLCLYVPLVPAPDVHRAYESARAVWIDRHPGAQQRLGVIERS